VVTGVATVSPVPPPVVVVEETRLAVLGSALLG
jgi:hypothetical protein